MKARPLPMISTGRVAGAQHVKLSDRLLSAAEWIFGVGRIDILNTSVRSHKIVEARHACFVAFRTYGWSYPRIAKLFNCDHTSVHHAIEGSPDRAAKNPRYAEKLEALLREIA